MKERLEAPGEHLLKPNHHHTVRNSVRHRIPSHMQTRRPSRAIVIYIVDGNLRHAELVEYSLAAGTVAVAVTGNALVNVIIVDLGVEERLDAGFEAEFGVVDLAAGFDEFGHTHAENVGRRGWRFAHNGDGLGRSCDM